MHSILHQMRSSVSDAPADLESRLNARFDKLETGIANILATLEKKGRKNDFAH